MIIWVVVIYFGVNRVGFLDEPFYSLSECERHIEEDQAKFTARYPMLPVTAALCEQVKIKE